MRPEIKLEKFFGPLDLLLSLIKDNQYNISDIALSEVTEQYLRYLDKLEENKAEELADFLIVGARLIFLKSRLLLPQFAPEEDDGGQSLEDQLKLYKSFVEASKKINKLWINNLRSVFRMEPPRKRPEFLAPLNLSQDSLRQFMVQLLKRLHPLKPLPQTTIDKAVSLKERLDKIRNLIKQSGKINFFELLGNVKNKTEIIVSFLALLELVKQKTVVFTQDDAFSDILIEKV